MKMNFFSLDKRVAVLGGISFLSFIALLSNITASQSYPFVVGYKNLIIGPFFYIPYLDLAFFSALFGLFIGWLTKVLEGFR